MPPAPKRLLAALLTAALFLLPPVAPAAAPSPAAASDPAAQRIEAFDNALINVMKEAKSLGLKGRYEKLAPVIGRTLNLEMMTSVAVGFYWMNYSPALRQKLVEAFRRWTIASYVSNFDGYSGQSFTLKPKVVSRGPDKFIETRLIEAGKEPVDLTYRMRDTAQGWKVIDVYYMGGISQITMRRSEFGSILEKGGAEALIKRLDHLSERLMSGAAGPAEPAE